MKTKTEFNLIEYFFDSIKDFILSSNLPVHYKLIVVGAFFLFVLAIISLLVLHSPGLIRLKEEFKDVLDRLRANRLANRAWTIILLFVAVLALITIIALPVVNEHGGISESKSFSTPTPTPTPTPKPSYPGTAWTPPEGSSPSRQDLDSVNNDKKYPNEINYPQSSSYLSKYEIKYVKSEHGHSIYLFSDPKCSMDTKRNHYVYEGYAVTVIACEGGASCIIYMNPEGHAISGWVDSDFLVY